MYKEKQNYLCNVYIEGRKSLYCKRSLFVFDSSFGEGADHEELIF